VGTGLADAVELPLFQLDASGIAIPGCSRSLPTNPSSDIDMYKMTFRMTPSESYRDTFGDHGGAEGANGQTGEPNARRH
jgi:hypothetical protein